MEAEPAPASGGMRDQGLFSAVVAVAAGLELTSTLRRIVQAAVDLSGATYGALGVVGSEGGVRDFIHVGMDSATVAALGHPPQGRGVLGLLIDHPVPLRIDDISAHPASAGFPDGHPPMRSFLGVPVRVRGRVFGNLYLTDKRDADRFTSDDEHTVMALAAAAAVAIENARLFEHTRMRGRWQAALTDIDNAALTGEGTEEVLAAIAKHARSLTGADVAAIALVDRTARPDGVETRHAVEIVDAESELRANLLGRSFASDPADVWPGAALSLHLRTPDRALGLLLLGWVDPGGGLDPQERELAESFASQASVTIALAESRREQERLMVYEDRDRIARDLHDLVIQRLFATGMQLQGTTRLAGVPDAVAERVARAVDDLDETIREIRQTIFALHEPIDSDAAGVRGRVLREAEQSAALLGFAPSVRFIGPVDSLVTTETGEHLIAVLREALANAAKHARAQRVDVLLEASSARVLLVVSDDGVGLDEPVRRSGLANLAARAADLGGSATFERVSTDGGTRVTWHVPVA